MSSNTAGVNRRIVLARRPKGKVTPDDFRLEEVPGVAVVFALATGKQCARSRRFFHDVGSDPAYPDLSARDAQAMREREAAGLAA